MLRGLNCTRQRGMRWIQFHGLDEINSHLLLRCIIVMQMNDSYLAVFSFSQLFDT